MSHNVNTIATNNPTTIQFRLDQVTGTCAIDVTDVTASIYAPVNGFHPEVNPEDYNLPLDQFRKSWGNFINIIYWNKYNYQTDICDPQRLTTTPVLESLPLEKKQYSIAKDGYYTIYRLFLLKKDVFLLVKSLYDAVPGYHAYVTDVVDGVTKIFRVDGWEGLPGDILTYVEVLNIDEVIQAFESQTITYFMLGTLSKEEYVSICYLNKCFDALSLSIAESIVNPCLTGVSVASNASIFGSLKNCESLFSNPLIQKRDILFMILIAVRIYVERCEYCKAEKLIEQIVGVNGNCNAYYFLCGQTPEFSNVPNGCGCN